MKCKVRVLMLVIWSCVSASALGECSRLWVQPDLGFSGAGLWIKKTCHNSTLALGVFTYRDEALFSSYVDRDTGLSVSPRVKTLSVLKVWDSSFGWGYADAGVGLGLASGDKAKNCSGEPGFLSTLYSCKIENVTTIGVPLHASAVLGRYVGIGLSVNTFLSLEGFLGASIGFSIPIGKFHE